MAIGMLWFDNDPKADLKVKIERAAAYYAKKYGSTPNLVFVHPSQGNGTTNVGDIEIRTTGSILRNHFLVCTENQKG